jgi:hypothetical protein
MFNGAENGVADIGRGKSIPDFTVRDTLVDDIDNDPVKPPDQPIGVALEIFFGIPDFQQDNPGKHPVVRIPFDTGPDDLLQFVNNIYLPLSSLSPVEKTFAHLT